MIHRRSKWKSSPRFSRPAGRAASGWLVGALALLLCGCSSFNRAWNRAGQTATPADSIAGRWEGSWLSDVNGHHGKLRCLIAVQTNSEYTARFRATYGGFLNFSYTVPLAVKTHEGGWEFTGEEDLGTMAGGVYRYVGTATPTNFHSTYESKYDHGTFELVRP